MRPAENPEERYIETWSAALIEVTGLIAATRHKIDSLWARRVKGRADRTLLYRIRLGVNIRATIEAKSSQKYRVLNERRDGPVEL